MVSIPQIPADSPINLLCTNKCPHILSLFIDEEELIMPDPPIFFYEKETFTCRFCSQLVSIEHAELAQTCSFKCLLKQLLFTKSKALKTLLSKEHRRKEDQATLNHLGALCYLQSFTLSAAALSPLPPFQVAHTVQQLNVAISANNKNTTWLRAQKIAESLFIEHKRLLIFLTVYQKVMKDYMSKLSKYNALYKKNTNKTLEPPIPCFDEQQILERIQEKEEDNLGRALLIGKQERFWHAQLYRALMHHLKFEPSQLPEALILQDK